MVKMKSGLAPFVFCITLFVILLSCRSTSPARDLLVEKEVSVPADGNTAEIVFNAKEGQRIRISLQAKDKSLQPYGYLTFPDSNGKDLPSLENSHDGKNAGEILLPQSGDYTLAVMDGSNLGGLVEVQVEVLE